LIRNETLRVIRETQTLTETRFGGDK